MTDEEAIQSAIVVQSPNINSGVIPFPKEVQEWFKSLNLDGAWNHPTAQFSMILVKDPAFRGAVSEINQKFQKNTVLGYEIAWVLLVWTIQAWRLSKAGSWFMRIWTQAWVSMLLLWGSLFFIPWLLWGKSYQIMLSTVFRAIIHQFWA